MLMYASLFLIGLSVFLVTNLMFQEEDEYKAQEKLELGAGSDKESLAKHGIVLKYSRPFFRRYVTPIVKGFKNKGKIKDKYKRNIATAGLSDTISPEDFFSFKLFLIIGFPVVFLAVRAFMEEDWALSNAFFVSIFGYFYPDLWIKGKMKARQEEILRNMPFAVDMLALSVEAGLDFIAAMGKVNDKAKPSALTQEFTLLMKEIKIGASRADALRNMSWRVDLIQISSFCATLIAADSVGASIGPILKSLSNEVRQKRSSDIEKAGATAATKILFPMMIFILPAVLLIVGAPLLVEFIQGGK